LNPTITNFQNFIILKLKRIWNSSLKLFSQTIFLNFESKENREKEKIKKKIIDELKYLGYDNIKIIKMEYREE
jgi:hypothetical protein